MSSGIQVKLACFLNIAVNFSSNNSIKKCKFRFVAIASFNIEKYKLEECEGTKLQSCKKQFERNLPSPIFNVARNV